MIDYIAVRLKRGKLVHAISVDSDSPRETYCNRDANRSIVSVDEEVTCQRCRSWVEGTFN